MRLEGSVIVAILSLFCLRAQSTGFQERACPYNPPGSLRPREPTRCPLPLDDQSSSEAVASSPWESPIRCLSMRASQTAPANESAIHCLFANTYFRSQGVVLLTSPGVAAHVLGTGGLDEPAISPEKPAHFYVSGPAFSRTSTLLYEVRDIPGKGKGVVALRKILKGEVIMSDFPALIADRSLVAGLEAPMRRGLLRRAVESLPEETRARVLDLAGIEKGANPSGHDVFLTNSCSVVLGIGVSHMALFPEVSRMNHDCRPNAFYKFTQREMTVEVFAYRNIEAGEEISISYAFMGMPRKIRRDFLRDTWGFDCTCSLCTAAAPETEASDARRMRVVELRDKAIPAAREVGAWEEVIRLAQELAGVMAEEGLTSLLPAVHEELAKAFGEVGELGKARELAALALRARREFYDDDSLQVEEARRTVAKLGGER